MKQAVTVMCTACAVSAFASAGGDASMIGAALFGMDEARWMVATVLVLVGALGVIGAWRLVNREVVRHGLVKVLLFVAISVPFMHVAGDKTNRVENVGGGAEKQGGAASRRANVAELEAPPPCETPRSGPSLSNSFAFTAFSASPSNACIALSWTTDYVFSAVGLYHRPSLVSNDFSRIDIRTDVANATNCAWTITEPSIVTNKEAFFGARGFLADDDSDADGVVAQREIALGLDPDLADTDGDFLSDGEELGVATVLTGEDFLWLDVSNGLPNVTHYRAISGFFDFFWLMDEYPLSMQGVACNEFDVYENGFIIIARDSAGVEPSDGLWYENGDLRFDPRSGGATVVAAVNYDMLPTGTRCAGIVETNGTCYAVYKAESQTASIPGLCGDYSVTYEVIVPFNETNTIYVSYLEVDDAFAAFGMDLGVQCPSMLSAINTNELYTIPAPPGALRPRTTVKYVIGANTDPCLADTDGDGLVDSLDHYPLLNGGNCLGQCEEWVAASFTNAEEIIAEGYTNWVARLGGQDTTNGLFELRVELPAARSGETLAVVGDLRVVAEPGSSLTFLEEKNVDIHVWFHPSLIDDPAFRAVGCENLAVTVVSPRSEYIVRLNPNLVVNPDRIVVLGDRLDGPVSLSAFVDLPVPVEYTWRDASGEATFGSVNTASTYAMGVARNSRIEVEATADGYTATGHVTIVGFDYLSSGGVGAACPSVLFLNDDSDNENAVPDLTSSERGFTDDELVPVSVSYVGEDPIESIRLTTVSGSGKVRFWSDARKTSAVNRPVSFGPGGGTIYMEGVDRSAAEGDVVLRAEARNSNGATTTSVQFTATVCRPVAEPICAETKTIDGDWWVVNPASVVIGERAFFRVSDDSGSLPSSKVRWEVVGSGAHIVGASTGWEVEVAATAPAEEIHVVAHFGDCPSPPPEFVVNSLAMRTVKVYPYILRNSQTGAAACTEEFVNTRLAYANKLYRQVGIRFALGHQIKYAEYDSVDVRKFDKGAGNELWQQVLEHHNNVTGHGWCDGVELYFCGNIEWVDLMGLHHKPLGVTTPSGTFISDRALIETLAHELGHSLLQQDLYSEIKAVNDNAQVRLPCDVDSGMLVDIGDRGRSGYALWSYRPGITANTIVERCLMLGQVYAGVKRIDISSGAIKSYYAVLCNVLEDAATEVEVREVGRNVIDSAYNEKNNRGFWDH